MADPLLPGRVPIHLPGNPYPLGELLRTIPRMLGPLPPREPGETRWTLRLAEGRTATRRIGVVGDILPLQWRGARIDPAIPAFFEGCDAMVGNLEGVVTDAPWVPFLQRHEASILDVLASVAPAHRWTLSVANNHAGDFGAADLARTCAGIEARGMRVAGRDGAVPLLPGVTLTAWTEWQNRPSPWVATAPLPAPEGPGIHLAYPHWGGEFERAPRRRDLPPGYAAVLGHHPHLAQPVEVIGGAVVAWSLGNFLTEVRLRTMGEGLALVLGLDEAGIVAVDGLHLTLDRSDRRWCHVRPG